ncbi:MAG: sugar ABC transporter ATP-binding protein [Reinekea forsetii]|uniref:L-arabinose transport ATP-binding protein AraG n=1 Tax=Reinekea forsetii TaxID=1336806 RepID=A0A2K8KM89_9GAMM|nr:multiple monosaccharide ABC transporter ATP-binding protein [Reinekea forsetii]ATX75955.1 L-arabinose transport ATP-binding protein AraG [Reinekea forsetii]MDO7640665.1 sugar ABC transporter ATP-binding protein [Reinekea forsetii]MDO7645695.1 sugar ABC transporter ATP-binding protein [Reinekea forsetii]MDO7674800.1 sugar ABC transporter ATP-binding protein [Reinekea forsetii]
MNAILEMKGISKVFPGVKALDNVSISVKQGEIHALVGENGAGKSTLMKVLSGVHPASSYTGDIVFEGEVQSFDSIAASEKKGIIIIHQELTLVPQLSIAENIFLGNEQDHRGVINWQKTFNKTKNLLKKVGLSDSPDTLIIDIGVGKQQLVEIAKALSKNVKLLILDEPTASLNEKDSDALLALLLEFKAQGIASILISHKLNEIRKVADTVTVIRDGASVKTLNCLEQPIEEAEIIRHMVGRALEDRFPLKTSTIGEKVFEIKNWNVFHHQNSERQVVKNASLNVRRGEIVGVAGLMGSGRTELAMSVFGRSYGQKISGQVFLHDKELQLKNVGAAVKSGLAYVTEDRKNYGLVLMEDIKKNITLANLEQVSKRGVIDENLEANTAKTFQRDLNIKCPSIYQKTINLSGGNQQKVVLSKWLFANPEILILDEPTRGIDVGAKYEIYGIIDSLAAQGKGVLMISSEMPELLGMCDRIYVMNEGEIIAEMTREEASQEAIMSKILQAGR